jgi:hypothetical protein
METGDILLVVDTLFRARLILIFIYAKKQAGMVYRLAVKIKEINNPAASNGVCCFGKVLDSGFNTQDYAPRLPRESGFLGIKRTCGASSTIRLQ